MLSPDPQPGRRVTRFAPGRQHNGSRTAGNTIQYCLHRFIRLIVRIGNLLYLNIPGILPATQWRPSVVYQQQSEPASSQPGRRDGDAEPHRLPPTISGFSARTVIVYHSSEARGFVTPSPPWINPDLEIGRRSIHQGGFHSCWAGACHAEPPRRSRRPPDWYR